MLRPEQMSKVSVTGSKSVMDDVIETLHELNLVHITDYDGSWQGFEPGDSLEGADSTSSQLVTVRAIESILEVEEEDAGATTTVDLENPDDRLESVRKEVNELDDKRDELRTRQRELEEQLDQMELFADLGIDLDLLWGYDSLTTLVGEGDPAAIENALAEADDIDEYDVFSGTDAVAVFAQVDGDGELDDAMVGVPFTEYEVPEKTGDPESNVADLENELEQVETELDTVENEIESLKLEHADFLLALEEDLTIEAQKYEAPLRFATTERSFIVEGWVPTRKYEAFEETLRKTVGDRVDVDELERAAYTSGGHVAHDDTHDAEHDEEHGDAATDGGELVDDDAGASRDAESDDKQVATDGGTEEGVVTVDDNPPVIQRNSKIVNPFEVLVEAVNRPKYSEFDPTITIFLTFPLFFGWMIGDMGYGLVYILIGYWTYNNFDSEAVANFGAVVAWMGIFTTIFGVLYGELFGLHLLDQMDIEPVLHKGLVEAAWAQTWLIVAVLIGWIHLNVGYIFNFIEELQLHGMKEAVVETGSWMLMLNGMWVFIFSTMFDGSKPAFLVGEEAVLASDHAFNIGFTGFPATVGLAGLVAFGLGILLILYGPAYEVAEFLVPVTHVLSYTRLTAVLLSKAGMALAANMLYFGAYKDDHGAFHFMHKGTPDEAHGEVVFGGLFNMGTEMSVGPLTMGLEGAIIGLPVLLIAHIVVLAIGGTAALQAIRLEYVEFFEKFYEGGGKNYQPFGYERNYTTDS
jgi:V/A-type H+-transporting ATPase subunit I